jgi:hypothetical protein
MSDQILDVLKIAFLILLYLFFVRVLWVVAAEVRSGRGAQPGQAPNAAPMSPAAPFLDQGVHGGVFVEAAAGMAPAPMPPMGGRARKGRRGHVARLFVVEPAARRGDVFAITHEITVGRSAGCTIQILDDTFVSNLHCRVFRDEANNAVIEDLGSTNGTYLNGDRLVVPKPLHKGDRIQMGGTIVEAQ